ncbi:hypothetical protein ACFQRB_18170 [Halobaculum litoreum]|uniref:Uncharacterized protein n=1 Tax=Halobaculum litoreum TaxID=3031998 RepID=A0ABD5XRZ6_9EURY
MARRGVTDGRRAAPADHADPRRCGCAGKTPLDRVVMPARERIATRLATTRVTLGPDGDAARLPGAASPVRRVEALPLDGRAPEVPFASDDRDAPVVTLACALVGPAVADPDRFAATLGDVYAGLDGPRVTVGKGHAVQVPGAEPGMVWLEHLRRPDGSPAGSDGADGTTAANVDAVHAFPVLEPHEQARVATLNARNDLYAAGATRPVTVRPLVAAPGGDAPAADRVAAWFREGAPADATVLRPSVAAHGGEGWVVGASVDAAGAVADALLPDPCAVVVTRPAGGLAAFALGHLTGDDGLRERGRRALLADTAAVADAVRAFRPTGDTPFDPAVHVARVTDASGEGIAGLGRLAAAAGRSFRLERLPVVDGVGAAAAGSWTLPDVTVETNGPLAVFAAPAVADRLLDRLAGVAGAAAERIGLLGGPSTGATRRGR